MPSVMLAGGEVLVNTHHAVDCQTKTLPRPCPIHHMTDHEMRGFPQHFRSDTGLMERICEHGVGHPDPDSLPFFQERGIEGMGVHGCDGCCTGNGPDTVGKHQDRADMSFPFNKV